MASGWFQDRLHALKLTGPDKRVDRWLKYLRSEIAGITERALVSTCGPFRDLLIYLKRGWFCWQRKWSTREVWCGLRSWINTHVYRGQQHSDKKWRIVTWVSWFIVALFTGLHFTAASAALARTIILHNGRQRSSGYRLKTVESEGTELHQSYSGSINFSNSNLIRLRN